MIARISRTLALGAVLLAAGCNSLGGVPEFKMAGIAPQPLHPGDTALITVAVKDRNNIINSITGVIREEPTIKLTLRDDGTEGDVKAGDGVWSLAVRVPLEAPPGVFNLTFTAYRSDGVAVPIRGEGGEIHPLAVEMPLSIQYKQ
ncbi:MAG: hypothetical protein KF886_21060 [Candidatus Hydrogenedentes bacterium]|nr:hypothetical protein [Candidatus Hydrogenedentota bacterium]